MVSDPSVIVGDPPTGAPSAPIIDTFSPSNSMVPPAANDISFGNMRLAVPPLGVWYRFIVLSTESVLVRTIVLARSVAAEVYKSPIVAAS